MNEPWLEPILRKIRFNRVLKYIKENSLVVDIGCGHTPHLLNRLEKYIKSGVGVDQLISNRKIGKIKLVSAMLDEKIPLPRSKADHITLIAVLEHLEKPDEILLEANRILKSNGTVIVTTPTPLAKPILEMLAFWLGWISKREILEHRKYYWGKELIEKIKKAGFKNIRHSYFGIFCNNFLIAEK